MTFAAHKIWGFVAFPLQITERWILDKTSYVRGECVASNLIFRYFTDFMVNQEVINRSTEIPLSTFPKLHWIFFPLLVVCLTLTKGGHTFLFTMLHPRWHLGVTTTHGGCLNPVSGDKLSPVLASEAVQRSAGRKESAAGRRECYRRRAETSR